jgi:hypothetical protein
MARFQIPWHPMPCFDGCEIRRIPDLYPEPIRLYVVHPGGTASAGGALVHHHGRVFGGVRMINRDNGTRCIVTESSLSNVARLRSAASDCERGHKPDNSDLDCELLVRHI